MALCLDPYIEQGLVDVIDWSHWTDPVEPAQAASYNDGLDRLRGRSYWVAYIDTDEFLFPIESEDLVSLLRDYESEAGVAVNWKYFGTSGVERLEPGESLIERLTWSAPKWGRRCYRIKSIVRPEHTVSTATLNSHRFLYEEGRYAVTTDFLSSIPDGLWLEHDSESVCNDVLLINHYHLRTRDWAYGEKRERLLKGTGRSEEEIRVYLKHYERETNIEEDQRIQRFVPRLKGQLAQKALEPRLG